MFETTIPEEYPDGARVASRLLAPGQLADLVSFRLHQVSKAAGRRAAQLCEQGFAVSRRQWRILSMLADGAPRSPSELAEMVPVDRGRMSRSLEELERRGFVSRRSVAGDARRQVLTLTPSGERLYRSVFEEMREFNMELLAALEPADRSALVRILAALDAQLGLRPAGS